VKRFLTQLQPVDFGAVAKRGCFVYCYLRADGTPYYVGIASTAHRPVRKGVSETRPPAQRCRVRVMKTGLTWEMACQWERFYIARYGRKDIGTGILRNRTEGGEGVKSPSPETIAKRVQSRGRWVPSDAVRQKMSVAQLGVKRSPEAVAKCAAALRGRKRDPSVVALAAEKSKEAKAAKKAALATSMGLTVEQLDQARAEAAAERRRAYKEQMRRADGISPKAQLPAGHVPTSKKPETRLQYSRAHQERVRAAAYALGMTIPKYKQWVRDGKPSNHSPYLRKTTFMTRKEICRRYYLKKKEASA
jgi:hypothetical protein